MKTLLITSLAAISIAALHETAEAAAYIKFDGIEGEARAPDGTEGWSLLKMCKYGFSRPGEGLTGQSRRRGSAIIEDISCEMVYDKASPKIAEALLRGLVIPTIQIIVLDDSTNEVILEIELANGSITSTKTSVETEPSTSMTNNFSLNFEEIKVGYTPTTGDKKKVEYSWKVEEGES